MSRISIFGHGGQLIAAAIILGSAAIASPVSAQSSVAEQTCRPVLGEGFSVSTGAPDRRCCMVLEEQDWYRANNVTGGRVYLRADALKVRPKGCSAAELAALGAGPGSAGPDSPDVPKKKPYVQPQSLLYGSSEGNPKPKPHVYY